MLQLRPGVPDRAGNYHSDALHVVERYAPMGPDHLMYEITIEDPTVFTQPWKIAMPLYRREEKYLRNSTQSARGDVPIAVEI